MAKRLLESRDVDPATAKLTPYRELQEAVSLLLKRNINLLELYGDVSDALDAVTADPDFQMPEAISQLAAISDFRLLVTLTPDTLLAEALRKRCAVNEVVHSPCLPTSEALDLPADWLKRAGEANLLYLFGKAGSTMVYAIHDEDLLEYAHNLLSLGSNVPPQRFLQELQDRHLLLIGCNFPEWLSRFFIRLTNKERLTEKKTRALLVEDFENQADLILFLSSYSKQTEILSDLSPRAFVAELHAKWLGRRTPPAGAAKKAAEPDPLGAVFFISYSRSTDLAAAERLFQSLVGQGVAEHEIWFDRTAIEPGQDFQIRIKEGIKTCRYFLPLISAAADRFDEKFFYSEWRAAIERSNSQGFGKETFVLPTIVDEAYAPRAYQNVPKEWVDHIHFAHAPGGAPNPEMSDRLQTLIRNQRKDRQGPGGQPPEEN